MNQQRHSNNMPENGGNGQARSNYHQQQPEGGGSGKSLEQMLEENLNYCSLPQQQQQQQQSQRDNIQYYSSMLANGGVDQLSSTSNGAPAPAPAAVQQQQRSSPPSIGELSTPPPPDIAGLTLADRFFIHNIFNEESALEDEENGGPSGNLNDLPASESCVPLHLQGPQEYLMGLRQWMEYDAEGQTARQKKEHLLRKTTVAHGIAELLKFYMKHKLCNSSGNNNHKNNFSDICNLDNFAVRIAAMDDTDPTAWNDIQGMAMVSPSINLTFIRSLFQSGSFFEGNINYENNATSNDNTPGAKKTDELDGFDGLGRNWEVEIKGFPTDNIIAMPTQQQTVDGSENFVGEDLLCHSLGLLLYELFAKRPTTHNGASSVMIPNEIQFATKTSEDERSTKRRQEGNPKSDYTSLFELGFPSSLSLLTKNLIECTISNNGQPRSSDAYVSLAEAARDLHLLLLYPNRFLFDRIFLSIDGENSELLQLRKDKLYGREKQSSILTDTFCRVSVTGDSEAVFVSGYSGSGKSKLVESVLESINIAGGYVISQKYDPMQSQERPLSVVISALNQLPLLMLKKLLPEEIEAMTNEFLDVFGPYISMLVQVIPNIAILLPQLAERLTDSHADNQLNFYNLHFILLLFMRVTSSRDRPVLLFLDDLQWSSNSALDLIYAILSDRQGSNCLFFVGSYRNNEVQPDNAIFGFINKLSLLNIPTATVHLDGMTVEELNSLVSDALCLLPHHCKHLSAIVYSKTKGNPYFTELFLRSLVDQNLIQYDVKERRCTWDESQIREENITDNVLHLLYAKLASMPAIQSALKVASCFGMNVSVSVVKCLSSILEYHDLEKNLANAANEGFMERSGSNFRFVHDAVREAAYNLIPDEKKNHEHFHLGMSIYNNTPVEDIGDDLTFLIADQINHGDPSMINSTQLVNIVRLNYNAAANAMSSSNYASARFYLTTAKKLLPANHWKTLYDMSMGLFLALGNAAFSSGFMEEASDTLYEFIENGRCLDDILDAYYLLVLVQHAQMKKPHEAYDTCLSVLRLLGEKIPLSIDLETVFFRVSHIQSSLAKMSDDELVNMKVMEDKQKLALIQFYLQLHFLSYLVKADGCLMHFYAVRGIELCLEHGVSKYAARAFCQFGMMLGGNTVKDGDGCYRLGKLALKYITKFNAADQLPNVYLRYFGFIAVNREPFQSCAEMLRQGHEIGLSVGDFTTGIWCGIHYIQKALISGTNLVVLKKEAEYQRRLIDRYSMSMSKSYMSLFLGTINALTGTDEGGNANNKEADKFGVGTDIEEAELFHQIIRAFWKGHYERCNHYAEKYSATCVDEINKIKRTVILFYHGILSFCSSKIKTNQTRRKIAQSALQSVRNGAKDSQWNFANKVYLLEAEFYSSEWKTDEAEVAYNASIASARSSKFIHEQGLACELLGFHYKRSKKYDMARELFDRAKACYTEWGSQVKISYIISQMEALPC